MAHPNLPPTANWGREGAAMPARNSIELSIPLLLGNGSIVRPIHCSLTADSLEGYTDDVIERDDTVLLNFTISSANGDTQTVPKMYRVTHAHPESLNGRRCTWFMAMPPNTADSN
jgi:hypothetical protein